MIDFVYRLNQMIPQWPAGTKMSLSQLSHATDTSVPHIIQFVSEGLGRDLDVAAMVGLDEAYEALSSLKARVRPELEARERAEAEQRAKTIEAYERMMERIRIHLAAKNWYQAFRTLSYFTGEHRDWLPDGHLTALCNDTVRIGIKAKANPQELGIWLEMGVAVAIHRHSHDGIQEALDFIDAYGEHFLNEESGKGALILGNLLAVLEEPAARFELWDTYKALINQLYPMD
ncbi:MAG: hypothetical protein WCI18_05315 [Pseudomonadota bacterium]